MADDRSIQLVNYNKQEKIYTFNKKALQQIIEENGVQDLPVSVISVAGLFRKGKSFLLNFFLRYLYAEDRKKWLNDSNESLKGFDWRGGPVRNTEGIHIWSKIFKLQTADGNQVAVILMDTQGTFDGKSSNKTGTIIFALSALVSSVQIYNLSTQINENDLENILLFTQYASFVQEESEERSFQSLIFLVRDWQFYQECPFGEEGGKMLLDEFLEITPDQEPSLTKVRNDLRSTFEKLSCFLLPYPGHKVATSYNFSGSIAEIEDEFITNIGNFVLSVLSPNNLVVKKVPDLGNLTCNEFFEHFATYLKYYNSDELPDEMSKAEAAAEAYYAPLLDRCVNIYKTEMMKMLDDYQDRIEDCTSQDFTEAHEETLKMTISAFNKAKRISSNIASSKMQLLTARVQELYISLNEGRSEMYSLSAAKHYNALASEIVKKYNIIMVAILNKSEDEIEQFTPIAYAKTHNKNKTKAIKNFSEEARFCAYDATEYLEKLKQDIDDSYGINENRRKLKFESVVRSYYNNLLETCLGEYNTKMRKLMNETKLETESFARDHEKHKSDAINEFNKAKCYCRDIHMQYQNKLQYEVEASFFMYEEQLIHKIELEKEKLRRETKAKEAAAAHEQEMERLQLEGEERERELQAEEERKRIKHEERIRKEECKVNDKKERWQRALDEQREKNEAKLCARKRKLEEESKRITEQRRISDQRRKEEAERVQSELQRKINEQRRKAEQLRLKAKQQEQDEIQNMNERLDNERRLLEELRGQRGCLIQ